MNLISRVTCTGLTLTKSTQLCDNLMDSLVRISLTVTYSTPPGYLLDALNSVSLLDTTNIIFTSDHGMTSASDERYVYLDDVLDRGAYVNYGGSPVWNIMPTNGREEEVLEKLKKLGWLGFCSFATL